MSCKVIADSSVNKLYLGRPWRAFSKTVFIRCELPSAIAAEGWDNWSNPENEKTVFYAEYKNTGKGASTSKRVTWSKQLSDKDVNDYTLVNIFSGCYHAMKQDIDWFSKIRTKPFEWPDDKK